MRERPIPFIAPMVRAILDGTKTQTRRVAKPKRSIEPMTDECPYGLPGDRLWVKEALRCFEWMDGGETSVEYVASPGVMHDDAEWVWKRDTLPGMFMPRRLSRLTLEITDVRVERLQDISADDCRAEGHPVDFARSSDAEVHDDAARDWYRDLWDSMNGDRAPWHSNPWVWVVSFRRVGA